MGNACSCRLWQLWSSRCAVSVLCRGHHQLVGVMGDQLSHWLWFFVSSNVMPSRDSTSMCLSSHKGTIFLGALPVPVLCLTFWGSKAKRNMVHGLATSLLELVSFRGSDCPSHWFMSGIPLPWSWQKSLLWREKPRPLAFAGLLPEC